MYRVLAVILLAYALCFPRLAAHSGLDQDTAKIEPSRAERLVADLRDWVARPINVLLASLQKPRG